MSGSEMMTETPPCFNSPAEPVRPCRGCPLTACINNPKNVRDYSLKQVVRDESVKQVGGDHYEKMGIDPWDVWDTWPLEQRIGAYRSNAVKYLMRMGTKDDRLQEAEKAYQYIKKLIEVLNNERG